MIFFAFGIAIVMKLMGIGLWFIPALFGALFLVGWIDGIARLM